MTTCMPTGIYVRIFLITAVTLSGVACKLRVIVPEGGRVVSESAAFSCQAKQKCTIDVNDVFFDETFQAEPNEGYFFRHWRHGDRFLCADGFQNCALSTKSFAGKPALEKLLESDEIFSLGPLFAMGTCQPSTSETTDGFQNIYVKEGQQCIAAGQTSAKFQGLVRTYRNGNLISIGGYDLGRMHGAATIYHDDGTTLQETSYYLKGNHHGVQKQYDQQGRLLLEANWQEGRLHGQHISYDYSKAYLWEGSPRITTSNYDSDQRTGNSRTDYPDGVWESRQWLMGMQQGLYEVFVPYQPGEKGGWRYVYVFVDGLIRYGYAYQRTVIAGTDEYVEEGGPESAWVWPCPYVNGVLDEATCFRDGLDLGPRI